MTVRLIAFTAAGLELARRLACGLGGEAVRCGRPLTLERWTEQAFSQADGLVFVGATGIAVRAIAPHVKSKAEDPAVVVVDEKGRFAIPILSGHLGGANDLARAVARLCGAVPVITTATDVRGVFAVDQWARRQGFHLLEPERIRKVSARLLKGEEVSLFSDVPIRGEPPAGIRLTGDRRGNVILSPLVGPEEGLHLIPPTAVLGVGCRRGVDAGTLQSRFDALLAECGLFPQAVGLVCSIDLKQTEPGLLEFCARNGLPVQFYSAQQLRQTPGEFSSSDFVASVTGVDNVCERSAVAGSGGRLWRKKTAGDGVTMAIAFRPLTADWRWEDESAVCGGAGPGRGGGPDRSGPAGAGEL